MVEPSDRSIEEHFSNLSPLTGEGIIIDIGTGDGVFVYQCARENPTKFYIGIDANLRPLEKISEKIHRKPTKGGLPNVCFVQSAVESLPTELDGVADEVHVHFPWGSLLRAVATGDKLILDNLRRVCSSDGLLEVVIGIDPERDRSETERLQLPAMSTDYIDSVLLPKFRESDFEIIESGTIPPSEWPKLKTTWAKRLRGSVNRKAFYIIARAV